MKEERKGNNMKRAWKEEERTTKGGKLSRDLCLQLVLIS